jgi:hypothetical protein
MGKKHVFSPPNFSFLPAKTVGLRCRSESGDVPERPLCGHDIDLKMWGFTSNLWILE